MRSRQAFPFHRVCEQTVLRRFMCDTSSVINPSHDHDIVEVCVATHGYSPVAHEFENVSEEDRPPCFQLCFKTEYRRAGPGKKIYLWAKPQKVQRFVTQPPINTVTLKVDADHAWCSRTRRSTTGIATFASRNACRRRWLRCRARSRNFYAIVAAQPQRWALQRMAKDYGHEVKVVLETDSVAGRDMSLRMGAGKVRRNMWQLFSTSLTASLLHEESFFE